MRDGLQGLCPHRARTGDIVVVLLGGIVPYILRESKVTATEYEFIGECFLENYMTGQAMREYEEGKLHLEEFNLV